MKSQKQVPETRPVPTVDINSPLKIEELSEVEVGDEEKNSKKLFYIGLTFLCIIAVATVLVVAGSNKGLSKENIAITASPLPSASPEALVEIDKTWKIEVLNGSGVPGQAKLIADKLKSLGFNSVITGNNKGGGVGNQVFLSASVSGQKDIFLSYLNSNSIDASYSGVLTEGSSSARIILH